MPDDGDNKILEFLMNDKKEEGIRKDKEKKKDEERRLVEREEDAKRLERFRDDIIETVKTEIKSEIQVAMEPIKRRQDEAEKEAEATNAKVGDLMEEVKSIRKHLEKMEEEISKKSKEGVSEPNSYDWNVNQRLPKGWRVRKEAEVQPEQESRGMEGQVIKLLRNARRVIGFKPIDKAHVHKCMERIEQNDKSMTKEEAWEKAKERSVDDFLKYEMKMQKDDIDQLKTVLIYPPAKEEWKTLYVEYENSEMVSFIMSFAKYLRKDEKESRPSVEKYIPMELFRRYSAIEKMAFEIRQKSNFKTSTNVSLGETDFILKTRSKEIQPGGRKTPWGQLDSIPLPDDLPDFELHLVRKVPQAPRSPTQAPGRPSLTPEQGEKRKTRGSPHSSSPASPTSKQPRTAASQSAASPIQPGGRRTSGPPALNLSNRYQCLENSTV